MLFAEPRLVKSLSRHRVRLVRGTVLASEDYVVPNVRFVSDGPIVAGGRTLAVGGRLMVAMAWRSATWACIVPHPGETSLDDPYGAGPCVRDSDNDGSADLAWDGAKQFPVAPLRLAPIDTLDKAIVTKVRLILRAVRVGRTVTVTGESKTHPGGGLINYEITTGSEGPWVRRLPLRSPERVEVRGVKLSVKRRRGAWWITASGHFAAPMLCSGGSAVSIGGLTIYSAGNSQSP
jgi:hypothetical protein